MAERDPLWLQAGNYTATEDRIALAAMTGGRHFVDLAPSTSPLVSAGGGHGVVGAADMTVTAGAGTTVNVSLGLAMVRGTQQSDQGVYITSNDAAKNLAISAADATNPRKDLVVTRVKDNEFGIAGDTGPLEIVTGTPTGGLTAGNATGRPTPPENSLVLAEVFVPAGAASSASYTITDLRTRAYALGGVAACSSTTMPNPASEGLVAAVLNKDRLEMHDGAAWQRGPNWAAAGRTGVRLRRVAVQNIGSGASANLSWDTEDFDSDGFIAVPSTTITIPAGLGGLYSLTARSAASAGLSGGGTLQVTAGGRTYDGYITNNNAGGLCTFSGVPLAAGDTITVLQYNGHSGALNFTGTLDLFRDAA